MDENVRSDFGFGGLSVVDEFSDSRSQENQNSNRDIELLDAVDAEKTMEADVRLQVEQLPQSSDPLVSERAIKHGKYNLRQSLAWDTAFFTSAGVLEPDELSSMIEGVGKHGKQFLPGIEEDVSRSSDTISTLESENLTLDSIEAYFFEDIRASIQKSSKASSKPASAETETPALKKVDFASNDMVKSKLASKRQNIGTQRPVNLIKQGITCPQGTQPIARNGGLTSSLQKEPKVIGRPNPILPSVPKSASMAANQVKTGNDKAKGLNVAPIMSKVPGLVGSSKTLPKPVPSSKTSYSNSSTATKKEPPKSSSSSNSSGSVSSTNVGISPAKSTRRKTVNPTSSSSILKKPLKVALKNKGQFALSDHLMSSKLPSNISPASSISEWSSASCSSTSTFNQRSNTSRASIDTSSPGSDRHEINTTRPPSDNRKAASKQTGALFQAATVKPSGLRMPSPKIGFFDGGKCLVRTHNKSAEYYHGVPAGPKIGPSGGSSKSRLSNLHPEKEATTMGDTKLETRKPASPLPSKKLSNASTKVSGASGSLKNRFSVSLQVQSRMDGASCLKDEKVRFRGSNRANDVSDTGSDVEKARNLGVLKSELEIKNQCNTDFKDVEISPIKRDTHGSRSNSNGDNIWLSEEMGDKNKLRSLYIKKENAPFEGQVDVAGISKQMLQKEFIGNAISQIEFCPSDSTQNEESKTKLSGSRVSFSPTFEQTAITRSPFTLKNSFCKDEGVDLSARPSIALEEKTSVSPLERNWTENNKNSSPGAHFT